MASETENESKKTSSSSSDPERNLLRKYYKRLTELGIEAIHRGTRLQHIKWMCLEALGHESEKKMNKWIGWIQCTLDYEGIFGLSETIEHTRKEMKEYERSKDQDSR